MAGLGLCPLQSLRDRMFSNELKEGCTGPAYTSRRLLAKTQNLSNLQQQQRNCASSSKPTKALSRSCSPSRNHDELFPSEYGGSFDELLLPHHCFGDKGCDAISTQLGKCLGLRKLDLSANNISSAGLCRLLPAIKGLRQLQQLRLDWNPIGPVAEGDSSSRRAVKCLCETAAGLTSLQLLSLLHCQLGPESAGPFSDLILNKSKQLSELHLRNNSLGEEGAAKLATSLKANKAITVLDLAGNGSRPSTLRQIANYCADNKKLQLLRLQQQEHDGVQLQNEQQDKQQQHELDDYVAKVEAELRSSEQQSERLLRRLKSDLTSSAQRHNETKKENFLLRQRVRELQAFTMKSNLMENELRQLLSENASLKKSLEERYHELCEARLQAQQQKLQLQLQQQQHQEHQQQRAMVQRQLEDRQDANEKLLCDLQQRELKLQQTELLLQQQQQDSLRAEAEAAQQKSTAAQRQQLLQQELERLQQQQQQLQQQLLEEKNKQVKQKDEALKQQQQLQQQLQQQQQRFLGLQQELQQETARRHQAEKKEQTERQALSANLEKANQKIEELQQRLHEQRETGELQQQQLHQHQQRLSEAGQEAATAAAELEELRSNQRHLAAKAGAAEAERQRQQDLLNKRQDLVKKLQQQLLETQQTALLAAAKAEEKQQELQQLLQQQEQQQQQQQRQLQCVQSEALQSQASLKSLRESHGKLKDELQRAQAECNRVRDEARHSIAELHRQQHQWKQQQKELWARLQGAVDQFQAVIASADLHDDEH